MAFGGIVQARSIIDDDMLTRAIRANDVAAARAALAGKADPNQRLVFGATTLTWSVNTQNPDMVAALLAYHAAPNAADNDGITPLSRACELGNTSIVTMLLNSRADVRMARPDGTTPLAICARCGSAEVVGRMLSAGASLDDRGQTPLMWAATSGQISTIAQLLESGGGREPGFERRLYPALLCDQERRAWCDPSPARGRRQRRLPRPPEHQRRTTRGLPTQLRHRSLARRARRKSRRTRPNRLPTPPRRSRRRRHNPNRRPPAKVQQPQCANRPIPHKMGDRSEFRSATPTRLANATAFAGSDERPQPAMEMLLGVGANPHFVAENGTNIVLAAAQSGSAATLEFALTVSPDANFANPDGSTALHMLLGGAGRPELKAMLHTLAAHGARTDIKDKRGITPAAMALTALTEVNAAYLATFQTGPAPGKPITPNAPPSR